LGTSEIIRTISATTRPGALAPSARALYLTGKRLLDVLLAALALVVLSPLWGVIALAIKLTSPGPVIYHQKRVRGNQDPHDPHPERNTFEFFKFRSMYVNSDSSAHRQYMQQLIRGEHGLNNGTGKAPVFKMKNDLRITPVGRFLRRTSLDELPQLINILRGDMSLVGPRPPLPYEVEHYDTRHKLRLVPQAGLTGLWQVSGRTALTFEEMVDLDIEYGRIASLWLDVRILLRTLPAVISGIGAW
jgi:lipopolysaccharide/colanic/teichoic acid biosynthesis glycosyltransferase